MENCSETRSSRRSRPPWIYLVRILKNLLWNIQFLLEKVNVSSRAPPFQLSLSSVVAKARTRTYTASNLRLPEKNARSGARSIQPKFPEISVQNSMDRFGPTGKVSKKRVHLLRWSSFPLRTGWKFGWMDRAPWPPVPDLGMTTMLAPMPPLFCDAIIQLFLNQWNRITWPNSRKKRKKIIVYGCLSLTWWTERCPSGKVVVIKHVVCAWFVNT